MTAHVVYADLDDQNPASTSQFVHDDVIRGHIGFEGFLVSDDIGMNALSGPIGERAGNCLKAGSDAVLHCNGDMGEMVLVADVCAPLTDESLRRFQAGREMLKPPQRVEFDAVSEELSGLLRS